MKQTLTLIAAAAALALLLLPASAFADAAAGKAAYEANCSACHGLTGAGDGPVGAALPVPARSFVKGEFKFDANGDGTPGTQEDLTEVIKKGAAAFGGSPLMAPWPTLSEDQLNQIVAYVQSLKQ